MPDALAELQSRVKVCRLCDLARSRTNAVPGEGSGRSRVMFIGEGPGFYEDKQGRPFVGPAGQLLDKLLASVGWKRSDVYITNVVKCRPPANRDPLPKEAEACRPYLDEQIRLLDPLVIVCLGRHALAHFVPGQSIMKVHGRPVRQGGRVVYPVLHPAAALRVENNLRLLQEDFKRLPQVVENARAEAEAAAQRAQAVAQAAEQERAQPAGGAQQLALF